MKGGGEKMTHYIVFDDERIVHSSESYEEAEAEFDSTEDFMGDLIFAEELARKR